MEETKEEKIELNADIYDMLNLVSEYNIDGVPHEWLKIRDRLVKENNIYPGAIDDIFHYYEAHNEKFDSWTNYLLACSIFTDKELNLPTCKKEREKLEKKIKQLLRKRDKNPDENLHEFLRKNPL